MSTPDRGWQAHAALRGAAALLVVLLLLSAGWFGWNAYTQWRQASVVERLQRARDRAAEDIAQTLSAQAGQLAEVLRQPAVAAALASGDSGRAAAAILAQFKGAEAVQLYAPDLVQAYQDIPAFGYARLGLLESALTGTVVRAHVLRDAQRIHLGLAVPVQLGTRVAVAYAHLPLQRLTAALEAIPVPETAYLALRQGSYSVVEKGNVDLAGGAETLARPLQRTGLRLAGAVPEGKAAPFGWTALSCSIAALLLTTLAILVVMARQGRAAWPRRRVAEAPGSDEPTFGQRLRCTESKAGGAGPQPVLSPAPASVEVAPGIFRAYDIRGVVDRELTPAVAVSIGHAIGSAMQAQGLRDVVVGRDGRLSSPALSVALIEGLRRAGCHVTDIGLAPTPVVYFGAFHLRAGSCVVVTGSHNPPDYNGFKVVIGGETLFGDAITALYRYIDEDRLHTSATPGGLEQRDIADDYLRRIADDVQLERPLKVVIDAGNGVGGELGPRLLAAIGAEVIPLYCEVDGNFPNHHPDPSEPANLQDLIQTVKRFDADLGIAFDGDADRLGVVTREGAVIYPDRLLMLFAADVLQRHPGALVIYDVKCSGRLADYVLHHGGSPLMWKTGHSLIKAKMRETEAELAGEMTGHFFFKERWYGFDDGLYAAARLLEILAQREQCPSEVLARLPDGVSTPELKLPVDGDAHALVARFVEAARVEGSPFEGARLSTIDGLRADFADGWGLLRASNTTPVLVLRFEADTAPALARLRELFRSQLQQLLPGEPLEL